MDNVLINPESGLAEQVPVDKVSEAIKSGYEVPLHDNEGNALSASFSEAQRLVKEGSHRQPSTEELQTWIKTGKFGTPTQQAIGAAEAFSRGALGPFSIPLERSLGVPVENIAGRKEINPGTDTLFELAGIAAGPKVAKALSLGSVVAETANVAAQAAEKYGNFGPKAVVAVKNAIEGVAYQAAHETGEALLGNPSEASQRVLSKMALSGALSAGAGLALPKITKLIQGSLEKGGNLAATAIEKLAETKGGDSSIMMDALKGGVKGVVVGQAGNFAKSLVGKNKDAINDALTHLLGTSNKVLSEIEKKSTGLFGYAAEKIAGEPLIDEVLPKEPGALAPHSSFEKIKELSASPEMLADHVSKITGPLQSVAPNLAMSLSSDISNAVKFLGSKIPNTSKNSPLDMDSKMSSAQISKFNKYVDILDHPINVFEGVKRGLVLPEHVEALSTVYPTYFDSMKDAVTRKMVDFLSKHKTSEIPYKTRLGLAQFLGQNLDSTMSQPSLMANQNVLTQLRMQKMQEEAQQMSPSKSGMAKMKSIGNDKTMAQQSADRRASRSI